MYNILSFTLVFSLPALWCNLNQNDSKLESNEYNEEKKMLYVAALAVQPLFIVQLFVSVKAFQVLWSLDRWMLASMNTSSIVCILASCVLWPLTDGRSTDHSLIDRHRWRIRDTIGRSVKHNLEISSSGLKSENDRRWNLPRDILLIFSYNHVCFVSYIYEGKFTFCSYINWH